MLRTRITWLAVGIISAVVVSFVIPLCLLVRTMVHDRAMAEARVLAQSTATLVASVDDLTRLAVVIDPVIQAAATSSAGPIHLCVTLPDGTRIGPADDGFDSDAPALIERAGTQSASFTQVTGESADVLTPVTVATGTVVVHTSTHFVYLQSRIWLVWATLAGLGAVIIGLGAFISRRMAERISTPVTEMADVAHRLREGDLSARAHTSAGASPTEVTELGTALNRLAARIAELLAGEREAAADLSHRLRTPVTALRLDTDLVADDAVRDRLRSHVEDLHRVIDSVVTEARRTSRDDMTAAGDLASVAAGRTAYWRPLAEDQDRSLAVEVPSTPVFVALPSADLRDLVDTLIDNVFAHTPEGTDLEVTVTATDGVARLAVADAGPGLASVDLVERGRSGNGGTGLGLDIVHRLADRAGGSVRLGRAHLGGLLVEVQLPHLPSAD